MTDEWEAWRQETIRVLHLSRFFLGRVIPTSMPLGSLALVYKIGEAIDQLEIEIKNQSPPNAENKKDSA